MKTLKPYTELRQELKDFRAKNQSVFAKAEAMQVELAGLESVLKAEVREAGKSVENETLAVIYQPRFAESYDYKAIVKAAKPTELELITTKAAVVDIDKKKFQELVKSGAVSIDVERKAFRRTELTPAILIKEKEIDHDA